MKTQWKTGVVITFFFVAGLLGTTLALLPDCKPPGAPVIDAACQEIEAFTGSPEAEKICLDAAEIGIFVDSILLNEMSTPEAGAPADAATKTNHDVPSAPLALQCLRSRPLCFTQKEVDYGARVIKFRRHMLDAGRDANEGGGG